MVRKVLGIPLAGGPREPNDHKPTQERPSRRPFLRPWIWIAGIPAALASLSYWAPTTLGGIILLAFVFVFVGLLVPMPSIGLRTRGTAGWSMLSLVVAFVFASAIASDKETERLAALKESDPAAYEDEMRLARIEEMVSEKKSRARRAERDRRREAKKAKPAGASTQRLAEIKQEIDGRGANQVKRPVLEIQNFTCTQSYGYMIIEGAVKNVSAFRQKNVQAVGSFYTSDSQFISSGTALVEYDPVLPGQTTPFKVMARTNPAYARCKIEFKEFWGGLISSCVKGSCPGDPSRSDIQDAQKNLNALGFDAGKPDGVMGPKTVEAIKAYQKSIGDAPTGYIDTRVRGKLRAAAATARDP